MAAKENVTTIVKSLNKKYPELKKFLEDCTKGSIVLKKSVHIRFSYPECIIRNRLYPCYGVFVDYFIRKYISCKYNLDIEDHRAKFIMDSIYYDEDDDNDEACAVIVMNEQEKDYLKSKLPNLRESYKIFTDPLSDALQNVDHIMKVSLCHIVFFGEQLPSVKVDYDVDNLKEIINYIDNYAVSNPEEILLNPAVGGHYFKGDGDLIIDDTIIDIKNSKNENVNVKSFYQLIMYSFGHYKHTNKKITKFIIYNPLLGLEYSLKLDGLDFDLFEEALKTLIA